jgi:8-oxo-dGTP pyrophosphatase MutT (NUDIX family)
MRLNTIEEPPVLYIASKNRYGDIQYSETPENNNYNFVELPSLAGIWTIKRPSCDIKKYYPNNEIRIYNNLEYLMSHKASKVISKTEKTSGSCGILSFCHNKERYFIMTADNKKYIQNPQGGSDENESPIECVKREIYEELNVSVLDEQCHEIGFWNYFNVNELIGTGKDFTFRGHTTLFFIDASFDQVKHLIVDELENMNIVSVEKYNFELDETQYVIISSLANITTYCENIELVKQGKTIAHTWNGHHRQAILSILNIQYYDVEYLVSFQINCNEIFFCDDCKKKIPKERTCYFCDKKYCYDCCPDAMSFHDCEECNLSWCKRHYRYCDDYCDQNKRTSSGCGNCGN